MFNIKCRNLSNNFKLYKRNLFEDLPYQSEDFAMNAETGILPIIFGYKIKEVPVLWAERAAGMGKSKFSIFKYGLSYLKVIINLMRKTYTKSMHKST